MKQATISPRPTGATQQKLSRRKIFYVALHIKGNSGKTWSASLTHAWALYRLMRRMTHEVVTFTYRKKDGTIRTARGTLPPGTPPRAPPPAVTKCSTITTSTPGPTAPSASKT